MPCRRTPAAPVPESIDKMRNAFSVASSAQFMRNAAALWVISMFRNRHINALGKQSHLGFNTDDCRRTYVTLKSRGVKFTSPPEDTGYGVQALFEDLHGNEYVMIEPRNR